MCAGKPSGFPCASSRRTPADRSARRRQNARKRVRFFAFVSAGRKNGASRFFDRRYKKGRSGCRITSISGGKGCVRGNRQGFPAHRAGERLRIDPPAGGKTRESVYAFRVCISREKRRRKPVFRQAIQKKTADPQISGLLYAISCRWCARSLCRRGESSRSPERSPPRRRDGRWRWAPRER